MPHSLDRRSAPQRRTDAPVLAPESSGHRGPALHLELRRSLQMHRVLAVSVTAAVLVALLVWALGRKRVYTAESLIYVEPLEVRVLNDGAGGGYDPSRYDSYLQQQIQTVQRPDTLEAALKKLPEGVWRLPDESVSAAVQRLSSSLKVERVLNSYQLAIDVTAGNPEAAAAAANAVSSAYLEKGRNDEHARADQRLQLLLEEKQRIGEELERDKSEQATLGRSLGVANPSGATGNPYDLQSEGLRSQLAVARESRDAAEAQLASVSVGNGTGLQTAANEIIQADAGLISIRQTLSQRRAVLSDQMAGLTPANPVFKQDQEEIAAIDRAMERATAEARQRAELQLQNKLRLDLRRTADVESRLNAQLAQQTAKATGAGPKLQRAAELETDLQRLNTRFATVDDAIRGLQLETGGPGQAHLALAARAPDVAQPSRSRLALLLALPLALFCGVASAVVARRLDRKIYIASDVQEVLGFQPMGVLPNLPEVGPAAYDEFLLRIAGALEGALAHGNARIFVFSSVSLEKRDIAWLSKLCSKLHVLGFKAACIPSENLFPVGGQGLQRVRSQEGAGLKRLQELRSEHEFVLIAAPPILSSAVTEYVVRCADATVLVAESGVTDKRDLRRASLLLEHLNPKGIGAVLEGLPLRYADQVFRAAVRTARYSPVAPEEAVASILPHDPNFLSTRPNAVAAKTAVESPKEQRMTPEVTEKTTQAQQAEAVERVPAPVQHDEFVPISTSFRTLTFSGTDNSNHLQKRTALDDEEQHPPASWSTAHEVEKPAFETEKFAPVVQKGSATSQETQLAPDSELTEEAVLLLNGSADEAVEADETLASAERERLTPVVNMVPAEPSTVGEEEVVQSTVTHQEVPEAEKPTSWFRRLVRFTEEPKTEEPKVGTAKQVDLGADDAEAGASRVSEEERETNLPARRVERPVKMIFREAARPVAVFESKTAPAETIDADRRHSGSDPAVSEESNRGHEAEPDAAPARDTEGVGEGETPEQDERGASDAEPSSVEQEPQQSALNSTEAQPSKLEGSGEQDAPVEQAVPLLPEIDSAEESPAESVIQAEKRQSDRPEKYRHPFSGAELPKESPMASTTRPRMMPPITMEAMPPLTATFPAGMHRHEPAEILPPSKPPVSEKPAPPVLNVAEGAARYRPGLARALRYATLEDGPPARASEGLTAMRRTSREVQPLSKEVSAVVTAPIPTQQDSSAGMSRKWSMLSRFERAEDASESGNEVLTGTGGKGRSPDSGT